MWHWESKSFRSTVTDADASWTQLQYKSSLSAYFRQIYAKLACNCTLHDSNSSCGALWGILLTISSNQFQFQHIPTSSTISRHLSCGWNMVSMGALVSTGINSLPASCRGRALEWLDVSPTPCDGHPHGEKPH